MELVCPAGTPAALRTAIDAGADTVYLGFRDETNARNFPGLNFSPAELTQGLAYAHARRRKVIVAITYPRAGASEAWRRAVDVAAELGADAVILADIGLLGYAACQHHSLRLHLSVQAAASHPNAIAFYADTFGIKRVILPRVLTVADIARLNARVRVETEVFALGGMCPMAEGRCALSSYVTGFSPNTAGVCSPASHVAYEEYGDELVSRLGGSTINRFAKNEPAGYPTLCKGRFVANGAAGYLFEEPTSLNSAELLAELRTAGVTALKIEGRQRGRAYIAAVVAAFRRLLDQPESAGAEIPTLRALAEGQRSTTGAYERRWW